MPPKRMTANPLKPSRHRAGKNTGADSSSDSDESDDETQQQQQQQQQQTAPPPKAPSATKIASNLKQVDLNAHRKQSEAAEAQRLAAQKSERDAAAAGFETASEGEGDEDESGDEEGASSSEEESSSEDEAPRRLMMRPKFVPKSQRGKSATEVDEEAAAVAEEAARRTAADDLVEEQIRKDLAAREAGKKHWDDDENLDSDVDTTDGLDPDAEEAAWRVRELKRIKRGREEIEKREAEIAEVERRRNLTEEERRAEDEEYLAKQQEEKDGKGKMAFKQKYFHKGAFFQEEAEAAGLLQRDIMGSRIADDVRNREALPEYLQLRDMTKLGRKGATKYKDMRSEDTGSWGRADDGRGRRGGGGKFDDERFRPDDDRYKPDERDAQGANKMPLGERRPRPRSRSRSRSPRRESDEYRSRKRSTSRDGDRYDADKRRRVDSES